MVLQRCGNTKMGGEFPETINLFSKVVKKLIHNDANKRKQTSLGYCKLINV